MSVMFISASAFDQDLGWCVDDDVDLGGAFYNTPCESTSCGVKQVTGGCAPTLAPTLAPTTAPIIAPTQVSTPLTPGSESAESLGSDGAKARSVASWLLVACLGVAF
jgi:hypothetical protein